MPEAMNAGRPTAWSLDDENCANGPPKQFVVLILLRGEVPAPVKPEEADAHDKRREYTIEGMR